MFQRNQKLGLILLGLGVGLLCACLIRSGAVCTLGGIGLLIAGVMLLRKC